MKLKTIRFPIFLGNQKERKENRKENIRKKKAYQQANESDLRVDQKP